MKQQIFNILVILTIFIFLHLK